MNLAFYKQERFMAETESNQEKKQGFLDKHPWVVVTALGIYVALLALGTVGEVFHVDWILNLPIFKGP